MELTDLAGHCAAGPQWEPAKLMEAGMKGLVCAAVVSALLASTAAIAQTHLVVTPEQRELIKRYMLVMNPPSAPVSDDVRLGGIAPANAPLAPVPPEIVQQAPATMGFAYFVWGDRFVFVDPVTRMVVQIIE